MTTFDANLVLNQLANGTNHLNIMVGAKNFVQSQADNWVSFKFTAKASNKANYIKIYLVGDLYTVEFGKLKKFDYAVLSTHEMIYADQLKSLFENETGLYLSL